MSLRSGLFSSLTVGRKPGNLLMICQFSGVGEGVKVLGLVFCMIALSLRLEVSDRDEPKLDFDDLFLLSFMRLLIQLIWSSLIFQMMAFMLKISQTLLLMIKSLLQSYFFWRLLVLFKPSFSLSSLIYLSLQQVISSFSIFSIFKNSSSLFCNCCQQSSVSRSIFFLKAFQVSSCFFFSLSNQRLMFSMAMVFSSTSQFNFLNCFQIQSEDSLRELTTPVVLDFSSSLRFVKSLISLILSSSSCMIFLERVLISLAFMLNQRSQLAFNVEFQCSLTSNLDLADSTVALNCAISVKRNSIQVVCVVFRFSISSLVNLLYFSLIELNSSFLDCQLSFNCFSSESIAFLQALA